MVETFFRTIKAELVRRTVFYTRAKTEEAIARHFDRLYNPVQRHSALDYTSPAQFERTASRRANAHLSGASQDPIALERALK